MALTSPPAARRRDAARRDRLIRFVAKPLLFMACLLPLAWLVAKGATGGLGANPIEAFIRGLGDWALRFLLLSLAITPIRLVSGWPTIMRFRRMLGLFAFFYAGLHLSAYVGLDNFFDWRAIGADIVKRAYITLGMSAFVLLVPLAVTSTAGWVKRLGAARWRRLHQLAYPAAILAVCHYYAMVKADVRAPLAHGAILAVLLGIRLAHRRRPALASPGASGARPASGRAD